MYLYIGVMEPMDAITPTTSRVSWIHPVSETWLVVWVRLHVMNLYHSISIYFWCVNIYTLYDPDELDRLHVIVDDPRGMKPL